LYRITPGAVSGAASVLEQAEARFSIGRSHLLAGGGGSHVVGTAVVARLSVPAGSVGLGRICAALPDPPGRDQSSVLSGAVGAPRTVGTRVAAGMVCRSQ